MYADVRPQVERWIEACVRLVRKEIEQETERKLVQYRNLLILLGRLCAKTKQNKLVRIFMEF